MLHFLDVSGGEGRNPVKDFYAINKELRKYSEKLRGYIGNKYKEYDILHNHDDNKFIYRYPLVQYKIINKKQLPMYRKRRKMKDVLTKEELSTFFNACENYMYKTIFMMI